MTTENNEWQIPGEGTGADEPADRYSHLPLEDQVPALLKDLEEAQLEASQNLDLAQRAQAELVNYKRRADEERISAGKYSNSRLITKLLPVKGELDLAITHAGETGPNASWLEGVKLIQRNLLNLLESEGVELIEAMGEVFNPMEHEALGTEETTEHPPGYIIQVIRAGYRLQDRVIQPAQVIVAREPRS
ncbi:MAG: nucleotide exchange factor GrpE [SAR202 cluster bacterium Io17-Chloro-G9]|nr:MAG: nucleotide exchange factor GrpE [SAR202 cluster bacterium Io17-Chloro-G9]